MTKQQATFDYLNQEMNGEGFEGISLQTMAIPFVRVIQDLSPQMKKAKPEYNPDAEVGMFVNTVSGKLYTSPIKVVIGKFERMFLCWGDTRGKLMGIHDPESVELNPKIVRNSDNELVNVDNGLTYQDCYSYYCLLADDLEQGVCIISMTSTNIKEAKKLNRNLTHTMLPNTQKRALPYFMLWEVSAALKSNEKGDWFGVSFKFDSFVTQLQLAAVVKERQQLPNRHIDYELIEDKSDNNKNAY